MSTLPMPAAPAAPAAAPPADAHAADATASHSPAFAAALHAALAPRTTRAAAHLEADAAVAAEAEDVAPGHDVVYHTHTAAAAASAAGRDVTAAILSETAATGTDTEHAGRTVAEGATTSGARDGGSQTRTPALGAASPAHAIDADLAADIIARNPGAGAARRSPDVAFRDAALLQPEFRARLDRVIERLEAMGHTVEVVETYRDQARQNHLYEQGRTRPGNVVTWTRTSNHTQGRAADLRIDGSFEPGVGYMRLAQVAAEEGLRTLGARDPGHVELPGSGRHAHAHSGVGPPGRHAPAVVASAGGIAGVAGVAPLAAPAGVAGVAGIAAPAAVATIAVPASLAAVAAVATAASGTRAPALAHAAAGRTHGTSTNTGAAPAVESQSARLSAGAIEAGQERSGDAVAAARRDAAAAAGEHAGPAIAMSSPRRPESVPLAAAAATSHATTPAHAADRSHERVDAADNAPFSSESRTGGEAAGAAPGGASPGISAARTQAPAHGADADIAGRIARVLQLQADAAARPLTRVLLRLGDEGADGELGRVRIDMRGATVTTAIDMADPARAAELRGRIHELEAALQQRGLETARLSVRSTANAAAATALAATIRPAGADTMPSLPQLDALLTGQHDRSTDRQPESGRQGAGRDPRQQQRQEAK